MEFLWWEMIRWINAPWTILLAFTILYWITVVIGLADIDAVELPEMNAPLLNLMNPGDVPLTVWISGFAIQIWIGSVGGNAALDLAGIGISDGIRFAIEILVLAPIFIWTTGRITKPLGPLFEGSEGKSRAELIGKSAIVTSATADGRFGTAEIRGGGAPVLIRIVIDDGEVIPKGGSVIVCAYDESTQIYHATRDV